MAATITFNPLITTNVGAAAFNVTTDGYIQGMSLDNPSARFFLSGGVLASTETLPMWGGVAVAEDIATAASPQTTPIPALGSSLVRSTSVSSTIPITGFTVFDQVHSAINFPQSPVPLIPTGGMVNFYRLGSGARIAVACDPNLVSLQGGLINANVSWNFQGQFLQTYESSSTQPAISAMTWASTNGGQIAITVASTTSVLQIGDLVNISGATTTGTGGNNSVNGTFVVNTWTSSTSFTVSAPGTSAYYGTITTSSAVVNQSGVALSTIGIQVLDVKIGNCMTVNYNLATGFATWNYNASAAIILLQ